MLIPPTLRCEVRPHRQWVEVAVAGELDLESVPVVDQELRDLRATGFDHLVLDVGQVTFIDSTGLQLLLTWTRDRDVRFALGRDIPPCVSRGLALVGMTDLVNVAPR